MSSFDTQKFESLLKTRSFGRTLHYFAETDSSSTQLKSLAAQGAPEGAVVLADAQSAGRGRWGRQWQSPSGKNLLFSFLLRPGKGAVSQLSAVMGLALQQACGRGKLKWPNDLWIRGRKCAGILIEGTPEALLVGIGLNVNQSSEEFPEALRASATSLMLEQGSVLDREALLAALLVSCESFYGRWKTESFDGLKSEWDKSALFIGESVRVGELEGRVLGLDDDGGLRLETAAGLKKLQSGEVFGLRPILD